jgi:hypothetical protein
MEPNLFQCHGKSIAPSVLFQIAMTRARFLVRELMGLVQDLKMVSKESQQVRVSSHM